MNASTTEMHDPAGAFGLFGMGLPRGGAGRVQAREHRCFCHIVAGAAVEHHKKSATLTGTDPSGVAGFAGSLARARRSPQEDRPKPARDLFAVDLQSGQRQFSGGSL